jgi:mitogen-activated protein kinase kinase 1
MDSLLNNQIEVFTQHQRAADRKKAPRKKLSLSIVNSAQVGSPVTLTEEINEENNTSLLLKNFRDNTIPILPETLENKNKIDPDVLDFEPSNWKRVSTLGRGSQGVVEKRVHQSTATLAALKLVHVNTDTEYLKSLKADLQLLQACDSEYILQCYGWFHDKGRFHDSIGIALEFMDMGSLSDIMQATGPINESVLGYITYQCLKGLEYLHNEKKMIHRDIKPSNLLVNSNGQVKIADFGVVVVFWHKNVRIENYMAPERIQGENYTNDSDLWSLGLSVLECALGRYPYYDATNTEKASTAFQIMDLVVTKAVPESPATCSEAMKDFISICLRKESGTRTSASKLLEHPLVKHYASIDCNGMFRNWLETVHDN